MKKSLIALALFSTIGVASAQTVSPMNNAPRAEKMTPHETKGEMSSAKKMQDMPKDGQIGVTPKTQMKQTTVDEKSRAEVKGELNSAKQTKDMPKDGQIAVTPKTQMEQTTVDEKSRAEVKNDLNSAKQAGKLPALGERTSTGKDVNPKTGGPVTK